MSSFFTFNSAFLLCFYAAFLSSCKSPKNLSNEPIQPEYVHPAIPGLDSLLLWSTVEYSVLQKNPKNEVQLEDSFSINGLAFTGWASEVFEKNAHKYRFYQFQHGKQVRQVGYYINGIIDTDFNMKGGKSFGSERMWMADGSPYVENYYIAPGVMHGLQKRWYSNHQLAKEAMFDKGILVYELLYDKAGNLIESKGQVPQYK